MRHSSRAARTANRSRTSSARRNSGRCRSPSIRACWFRAPRPNSPWSAHWPILRPMPPSTHSTWQPAAAQLPLRSRASGRARESRRPTSHRPPSRRRAPMQHDSASPGAWRLPRAPGSRPSPAAAFT